MLDQQISIGRILRPPTGFEAIYQGEDCTTPIPFVAADDNGAFLPLDTQAGNPGYDDFLCRYVPVALGSTIFLFIPRPIAVNAGGTVFDTTYTYELRWRIRDTAAWIATQQTQYHLPGIGPAMPSGTDARMLIPPYTSVVFQAAAAGISARVLVAAGQPGTAGQGTFDPTVFAPAAGGDEMATGPLQWFLPCIQRCVGDELSVVAYRTTEADTWDFAATDAGFSNVYGTNQLGPTHPNIFTLGMILSTGARAAGP